MNSFEELRLIAVEIAKNTLFAIPLLRVLRYRLLGSRSATEADSASRGNAAAYVALCEGLLMAGHEPREWLVSRRVLEIGPGAWLDLGLRVLALGAAEYWAIDRFADLAKRAAVEHYQQFLAEMPISQREKCEEVLVLGDSSVSFRGPIRYWPNTPIEACESLPRDYFDLIYSHAVLEHAFNLDQTFAAMSRLLRVGGLAIHIVDVSTHGQLAQMSGDSLAMLRYPDWLWHLMSSNRGYPNRKRPSEYLAMAQKHGLSVLVYKPRGVLDKAFVAKVKPRLNERFRQYSDEDLQPLSFVLICQKG